MAISTRKLGDAQVSALGYGAMGIAAFYGSIKLDEERFKVLDAVYESGCTNWDTADIYHDSEELIGRWFTRTGKRSEIFLASKFGFTQTGVDGSPEYMRQQINQSLQRLQTDYLDLYYLHRPDANTPIEVTVGAMAELVKEGKVKQLGLSEVSANTLRRAHAVHPIAAVQLEYSPFTLDIEDPKIGLLTAARELGVTIVAYAPLGRGLLTGRFTSPDDFEDNDFRRHIPRYSKENFPNILELSAALARVGKAHSASAGQVSLAWLLAQGPDIVPISGTSNIHNWKENVGAIQVQLTPEDMDKVRRAAQQADRAHQGERYPTHMWQAVYAETPELKV